MAEKTLHTRLKIRRDTNTNLSSRILAQGEPGYTTDTHIFAIGDGSNIFNNLTTKVPNADQLDGHDSSYFATVSSLNNYLLKSGGSMSGPITFTTTNAIKYQGTKATYSLIRFIDNTGDTYGNGISIGGGGRTVIGGGESAGLFESDGGNEQVVISSDSNIDFYSNCQNGLTDAQHINFNYTGALTLPGVLYARGDTGGAEGITAEYAGLNMRNSNLVGLNGLYFEDYCQAISEGIHFKRSDETNFDTFKVKNGRAYIYVNRKLAPGSSADDDTSKQKTIAFLTDMPTSLPANGGTATYAYAPTGFTHTNSISWGTLSGKDYTYRNRWDTAAGGSIAFADKGDQTYMQLDGTIYVDEGQHPVATETWVTNTAKAYTAGTADRATYLQTDGGPVTKSEATNELNIYYTGETYLNYRGGSNTLCIGDGSGTQGHGTKGTLKAGTIYEGGTSLSSKYVDKKAFLLDDTTLIITL